MRYLYFTPIDFLSDPFFVEWVHAPNEHSDLFWDEFLRCFPHKKAELDRAIYLATHTRFSQINVTPVEVEKLKMRIWADLGIRDQKEQAWKRIRYLAAASLLLAAIFVAQLLYQSTTRRVYVTNSRQIKTIKLGDGSMVTLNARSKLSILKISGANREVALEGEGYFDIAKIRGGQFLVHTRHIRLEVIGTEFNVNTRRNQTKVVLTEGRVKLMKEGALPMLIKPGEMAVASEGDGAIQRHFVEADHYSSWKDHCIVMQDRPVSEILELLEDSYGVKVKLRDTTLLSRKLSGKLMIRGVDGFVNDLATILMTEARPVQGGYLFY